MLSGPRAAIELGFNHLELLLIFLMRSGWQENDTETREEHHLLFKPVLREQSISGSSCRLVPNFDSNECLIWPIFHACTMQYLLTQ